MKQNERLIKIDGMLRREPHPSLQDFIKKCCASENSTATIVRDLNKLKNDFGRKIIYDTQKKDYSYEEEYPCLTLSDFESVN